jgi:N-acetylglucosaminylphosphatidylinositol deacetylase
VFFVPSGDFEKKGQLRKKELQESCRKLGMPLENVTILNHDKMKDGMKEKWPIEHIASVVANHALALGITTVSIYSN